MIKSPLPFLLAALLPACAVRALPDEFPKTSAPSRAAPEGQPVDVGVPLREEPPLPGETSGAWGGLDDPRAPASSSPATNPEEAREHQHVH